MEMQASASRPGPYGGAAAALESLDFFTLATLRLGADPTMEPQMELGPLGECRTRCSLGSEVIGSLLGTLTEDAGGEAAELALAEERGTIDSAASSQPSSLSARAREGSKRMHQTTFS